MPPTVVAFFCEDIRLEHNSQRTLVGILPDNLQVPSVPGLIPKIGIYVRLNFETDDEPKEITLELRGSDGSQIALPQWSAETISGAQDGARKTSLPIFGLISTMVMAPFQINSAGQFVITLTVDGQIYTAGVLNVIADSPNASEPPASQSL